MSGQRPSEIFANIAKESAAEYKALAPFEKGLARASFGAGLLALCAYVASTLHARDYPPSYQWVWVGLVGFGCLTLYAGLRGARGPRDPMQAFWAIAVPVGYGAGLDYFFGPDIFQNFYVRGFAWSLGVAGLVRLFLSLRGTGGSAEKIVRRQVEQNEINWKPAGRR